MGARKILLRFDDICPTMNWTQWEKAKALLDKAEVKPLLGIVPDCTDPDLNIDAPRLDFWDYIKSLQNEGYSLAMHGYHHLFETKANGIVTRNKISEFAGLSYDVQFEKIQRGKEIMNSHGIETDIFFAPAHSYDDNTLKALAACGFRYVSDGLSSKPYRRQGIILLPCRSGGIPKMNNKNGYVTAVVHAHEWEREDKAVDYTKYNNLLEGHFAEIVSFKEFSKWHCGNAFVQRFVEWNYRVLRDVIVPRIRKIIK